jgi:hypothetical protein
MYPWSHTKEKIHDWQELHSIGITIATAIETISGQEYTVRNINILTTTATVKTLIFTYLYIKKLLQCGFAIVGRNF